jgi:hypothetical protein
MKRITTAVLFLVLGIQLIAQTEMNYPFYSKLEDMNVKNKWGGKCGEIKFLMDSVYSYLYDKEKLNWNLYARTIYHINSYGFADTIVTDLVPSYKHSTRTISVFSESGGLLNYFYEIWQNNCWSKNLKIDYFYTSETITEAIIYNWDDKAGVWNAYQKEIYFKNELGLFSRFRMLRLLQNNEWIDYLERRYSYDESNRLIRFSDILADGRLLREATYYYNSLSDRISEVLSQSSSFLPDGQVLSDSLKTIVEYDVWGNSLSQTGLRKINDNWIPSSKTMNFYHLDPKVRKVTICHNGQTICVSINAVQNHLKLGDKLGDCISFKSKTKQILKSNTIERDVTDEYTSERLILYPNPTSDYINLSGIMVDRVKIYNSIGLEVFDSDFNNTYDINININNLNEGIYYIHVFSGERRMTKIFIIKK